MPTQAEEHRTSQPQDGSAGNDAVQSRVSELLDNATVAPDDDFAREVLARDEPSQDESAPGPPAGSAPGAGAATEDEAGEPALAAVNKAEDTAQTDGMDLHPREGETDELHSDGDQASFGEDVQPALAEDAQASAAVDAGAASTDAPDEHAITESDGDTDVEGAGEGVDPSERDEMSPSSVRIRGRPGGVLVEIENEGEWSEVLELLEERLGTAEGFFRGGKAVVEVGARDVYEDELRQARDMLARHDMTLAVVRSTSDLTLQSSLLLGLSTSSQAEEQRKADLEMAPVVPITQPKSPYFVHNGTLRSGQVLRKAESIMIVGDVNPGAKVISGGDVMVWGRLRGMAYAGASGNKGARVAAIEFSPTQLRIATVTAVPPDPPKKRGLRFWKQPAPQKKRPEVAHVAGGNIVVEPWDDSRPGRPRVVRE